MITILSFMRGMILNSYEKTKQQQQQSETRVWLCYKYFFLLGLIINTNNIYATRDWSRHFFHVLQ